MNAIVPIPRCELSIRPATMSDYAFIDRLQDMHTKALGFMPKAQLESKIVAGHILVAEDEVQLPIGYVMSQDRYFKRDDVGIVYQLNVSPGKQRALVGAALMKAVFDRAAYGCKLFCCWCAQDLSANYFWEALGFVPLAFRAGSEGANAAHIFWQKRIREGDVTTPYWYPCKTDGGHMREDRIVLPIPPGVHWRDEMPMLLPSGTGLQPVLSAPERGKHGLKTHATKKGFDPTKGPIKTVPGQFKPPGAGARGQTSTAPEPVKAKMPPVRKAKAKVDPVLLAKARELRDRYLEQFNSGLVLQGGKYEVTRALPAPARMAERLPLPYAA